MLDPCTIKVLYCQSHIAPSPILFLSRSHLCSDDPQKETRSSDRAALVGFCQNQPSLSSRCWITSHMWSVPRDICHQIWIDRSFKHPLQSYSLTAGHCHCHCHSHLAVQLWSHRSSQCTLSNLRHSLVSVAVPSSTLSTLGHSLVSVAGASHPISDFRE